MDDYRVGYLLASMASPYNGHRNMSSEVRMAPRPPKTTAWSHGLLPSPVDDPSSCSDNASDNSDKIESYCQSQAQGNGNKTRKRKIVVGGPSFMNSGGPLHDGTNRGQQQQQQQHESIVQQQQQQQQKDETRNSLTQGLWTDAELAADFDGSLSGLGADLSTSSYDMSEALLALPTIYHQQRAAAAAAAAAANNAQQNQNNSMGSGYPKNESGLTPLGSSHLHGGSSVSLPGDFHFDGQQQQQQQQQNSCQQNSGTGTGHSLPQETMHLDCERRFQYVLAAATSVATKVNEETLTYLNQCQPYEIKLKKLGELTAYRGVVFRTVVRLCFHDRRLQFSEREQLALWEDAHPNDRILQVDLPLSYGVSLVPPSSDNPSNVVSFMWEPLKEVGLYIKVNCISTEFTPKKHGGEKGVPFRLMIETYSQDVRLHAGACQIKVFKLKGADRKHKQDREKILKKTPGEQSKLQPSYDCTVLSDISLESLESPPPTAIHNNQQGHNQALLSPTYSSDTHPNADSPDNNSHSPGNLNANGSTQSPNNGPIGPNNGPRNGQQSAAASSSTPFSAHFSPDCVRRWLIANRFASTKSLWDFSGVDLLRLGKEELIEICGLPEGIRLYNALHYKITFFVLLSSSVKDSHHQDSSCSSSPSGGHHHLHHHNNNTNQQESDPIYHPICLSAPSITEMTSVVGSMFYTQFPGEVAVERLLLSVLAPGGTSRIRVLLTEQLLSTLKDQTAFKAFKSGSEVHLEIVEG